MNEVTSFCLEKTVVHVCVFVSLQTKVFYFFSMRKQIDYGKVAKCCVYFVSANSQMKMVKIRR